MINVLHVIIIHVQYLKDWLQNKSAITDDTQIKQLLLTVSVQHIPPASPPACQTCSPCL